KTYGLNDPSVNATTPSFTGRVNASVTDWNGAVTALDDKIGRASCRERVARTGGETVGSYNILSGTAGGTAIGNYTATVNTNGQGFKVWPGTLTVDVCTNDSKTYGLNDPSVNATTPSFTGRVNASVTDWNGAVTALDD